MSRLQSIENALNSVNETIFQELCDHYLLLRNKNYAAFIRAGSQTGKQKTVKGTPDSLFLLPNGMYLFVEYSTNKTAGAKKLKDDIKKCIDTNKTKISINQIAEIIICINFNLKLSEIKELKETLRNTRISLTLNTLDSLAIEINLNHRDLAHKYLGLPLDTGQVISITNFIDEYNKSSSAGISTSIDNVFLFRDKEQSVLKDALSRTDFIILTGPPGVGKTKLAIETINEFVATNPSYQAYAVSYKHHELLTDLYHNLRPTENYILFVDDANRIDALSQIIGFYTTNRSGKLKIILTVRDYAYYEVYSLFQNFNPHRLDIAKFSDAQIIELIKSDSFKILNPDYQEEIVRIADGNPRIAIMASLLAIEKQNLFALADVTDLFEKYFSALIKDNNELTNQIHLKCLGIISFFYTIPYKEKEITSEILKTFDIKYENFIDSINSLDKLELIDIQYENVKIPEQNLATYFFYKTFIKDSILSFNILLNKYFETNTERFRDCIIPANNTFGHLNVLDKIRPQLINYWNSVKEDSIKAENFLNVFWLYLQLETFEFYYKKIQALPIPTDIVFELSDDQNHNIFSYDKDKILEIFSRFFRIYPLLKESLELCFEYVRKTPLKYSELISQIKDNLVFDRDDEQNFSFKRQNILFDILIDGIKRQDNLLSRSFYDLSKIFMRYHFNHSHGGRNNSIIFYDYYVPLCEEIKNFREKFWNTLNLTFSEFPDESIDFLESYVSFWSDYDKDIILFDSVYILKIIEKNLYVGSFRHCKYVQQQIRKWKTKTKNTSQLQALSEKYRNNEYEVYLKIDWDRFRDKESFEYTDYNEYERLKEEEIRSGFIFQTAQEIYKFFEIFLHLKKVSKNDWSYNNSLDFIIDENFIKNFKFGCELLKVIIASNNEISFTPRRAFNSQLNANSKANEIWQIIHLNKYKLKPAWELSFFDFLDESLLNEYYAKSIVNSVKELIEPTLLHLGRLERYRKIYPSLFKEIIQEVISKNEQGIHIQVWMDFLEENFSSVENDIKLIEKFYLLQNSLKNYFDYQGKVLANILKEDPNFILEYVQHICSKHRYRMDGEIKEMGFVWEVDGIEGSMFKVFDFFNKKGLYYGILEHFCNSFYVGISEKNKAKAESFLLNYMNLNHSDSKKINIVVDILRHSKKDLFEKFLLHYLTLNQDVEVFSKIYWRGSGTSGAGDVILSDIEAAQWRNILSIVNRSDLGIALLPIKKYLSDRIESAIKSGDWERKRRFLERYN